MITLELIRSFRFFDYAVFDLVISFVGFYLFGPLLSRLFLKIGVSVPRWNWLYLTLPVGIVVHLIFGRITLMVENFFDMGGHWFLKVLIFGLLVRGLWGVELVEKKSKS